MKKLIATLMLGAFATTCTMSAMAAPSFDNKTAHHIDKKPMPKFAQDQHKKPAPHLKQDFKKPMPKV